MKFLDNILDKFIYWFDPPEQTVETALNADVWTAMDHPEPEPEPAPAPRALREMSQRELEAVVSKYVASVFKEKEPTVESERLRYAVYRIGAFQYGNRDIFFLRAHDSLVGDLGAVYESCEILVKFVKQQIENSPDPVNDDDLSAFLRAAQYLITKANRTFVSVVAQESLKNPEVICPTSLPCWPDLADLAGKEAA
jgi:hypothetical protein